MTKTFTSARAISSHPIQTKIILPVENFYRFSCLIDNSDGVRITAYSDPEDGMMILYIACRDREIAEAMDDVWA